MGLLDSCTDLFSTSILGVVSNFMKDTPVVLASQLTPFHLPLWSNVINDIYIEERKRKVAHSYSRVGLSSMTRKVRGWFPSLQAFWFPVQTSINSRQHYSHLGRNFHIPGPHETTMGKDVKEG